VQSFHHQHVCQRPKPQPDQALTQLNPALKQPVIVVDALVEYLVVAVFALHGTAVAVFASERKLLAAAVFASEHRLLAAAVVASKGKLLTADAAVVASQGELLAAALVEQLVADVHLQMPKCVKGNAPTLATLHAEHPNGHIRLGDPPILVYF